MEELVWYFGLDTLSERFCAGLEQRAACTTFDAAYAALRSASQARISPGGGHRISRHKDWVPHDVSAAAALLKIHINVRGRGKIRRAISMAGVAGVPPSPAPDNAVVECAAGAEGDGHDSDEDDQDQEDHATDEYLHDSLGDGLSIDMGYASGGETAERSIEKPRDARKRKRESFSASPRVSAAWSDSSIASPLEMRNDPESVIEALPEPEMCDDASLAIEDAADESAPPSFYLSNACLTPRAPSSQPRQVPDVTVEDAEPALAATSSSDDTSYRSLADGHKVTGHTIHVLLPLLNPNENEIFVTQIDYPHEPRGRPPRGYRHDSHQTIICVIYETSCAHWLLGVFRRDTGWIKVYDPLPGEPHAENACRSLSTFVENDLFSGSPCPRSHLVQPSRVPLGLHQSNALDCGVYALAYAYYEMYGLELPTKLDVSVWRRSFSLVFQPSHGSLCTCRHREGSAGSEHRRASASGEH